MSFEKAIEAYFDYCERNNFIYQPPDPECCTELNNHLLLANNNDDLAVVDFNKYGEVVSVVAVEE